MTAGTLTAGDPRLLKLAAEARVRPPHCFHVFHAIAADPAAFDPAAFALFAQLEERHVLAIVEALRSNGLMPVKPSRQSPRRRGERLPESFSVPTTWKLWAQTERGWTPEVVETVASEFVDYWHSAPNGAKLNWEATWRNWVRGSKRPSGTYAVREAAPLSPEEQRLRLAEQKEFLARIGRD